MRHLFLILATGLNIWAQEVPRKSQYSPLTLDASVLVAEQAEPLGTNPPSKVAKVSFLLQVGMQYKNAEELSEAEQTYLRALKIEPNHFEIRFQLSILYIQTKRYAKAIEILETLAMENQDNPFIQNNLAWVYATGGEAKNGTLALRHSREALLIAPYSPILWNTLAEAYCVFGQYDKALRASEHALNLLTSQKEYSQEDFRSFEAQLTRIRRAKAASTQLFGLEQSSD